MSGLSLSPTSGTSLHETITLNSTRSEGTTSLHANVWVTFADGTQKSAYADIDVELMPVEYSYQLVVDNYNQIATNLAYYNSTTVNFHVQDRNGAIIESNDLSWEITSNQYQFDTVVRRTPAGNTFSSSNNYADSSTLQNINTK